jgi:hypothetical protein
VSEPEISYCEQCGEESGGAGPDPGTHSCVGHAEFEPPRYCSKCRRRMVVQVTPSGWSARCSRHGVITSNGAAGV